MGKEDQIDFREEEKRQAGSPQAWGIYPVEDTHGSIALLLKAAAQPTEIKQMEPLPVLQERRRDLLIHGSGCRAVNSSINFSHHNCTFVAAFHEPDPNSVCAEPVAFHGTQRIRSNVSLRW